MQFDMFEPVPNLPALQLMEHPSSGYAARTGDNARGADVTVAFATDFSTAGERLTARMAGKKYLAIAFGEEISVAADKLSRFMQAQGARSLNVAGNGIYTLKKKGISQREANQWVYDVLKATHARTPLDFIRSGGQTGIDTAGLVAGLALGKPIIGLYPQGYRRRLASGQDVEATPAQLEAELRSFVSELRT